MAFGGLEFSVEKLGKGYVVDDFDRAYVESLDDVYKLLIEWNNRKR